MTDRRLQVFSFVMRDIRSEAGAPRSLDGILSEIAAQDSGPTPSGEDRKSAPIPVGQEIGSEEAPSGRSSPRQPDMQDPRPHNQEFANGRFDLEAYVKDAPQIRIALLTINQFQYLQGLGEIGWSTDFGVSAIDNQHVLYAFSENDHSMNALARLITIDKSKDDDSDDGDVTPTGNNNAVPLPIDEGNAHVPAGNNEDNVIETSSDSGDEGTDPQDDRTPEQDATIEGLAIQVPNLNPEPIAPVNDIPDNFRVRYAYLQFSRLYGLALSCIRVAMLLAAGGVLGAFGLWVALAYGISLYSFFEHLWLFSLSFLGREVVLWAFHLTIRKLMKTLTARARRAIGMLRAE
ncbi:hypothetical protein DFP72DRAFT_857829 [Ephemerocybe angulata]|uniref:Uncharacterized protein n=1 Tax=Ephemerocybe angulata TaxID=980116 RepID=A0A8H6LXG1_9AGAR|nr:hypothetical protein DFP72DRAFT_857829 [Tulosesus angulatus]